MELIHWLSMGSHRETELQIISYIKINIAYAVFVEAPFTYKIDYLSTVTRDCCSRLLSWIFGCHYIVNRASSLEKTTPAKISAPKRRISEEIPPAVSAKAS